MKKKITAATVRFVTAIICAFLLCAVITVLAFGLTAWNTKSAKAAEVSDDGTTVTFEVSGDFVYDGRNNIVGLSSDAKEKLTESVTKIIVKFPTQAVIDRFAEDFDGKAQVELHRPEPATSPSLDVNTFLSGAALHKMNVAKVFSSNTRYFSAASDGTWCGTKSDGAATISLIWSFGNTIPSNTTEIKAGALLNATEVTVPANVQIIDINAFDRSKLTKLTVDANNTYYGGGIEGHDCLLYSKSNTVGGTSKNTLFLSKDGYIPDDGSVKKLAVGSLHGVTSVTIPASVTDIDYGAFDSSIQNVAVAEGIEGFKVLDYKYLVYDWGDNLYSFYASTDGSVPEGIDMLSIDALTGYSEISLPSTLTYISGSFDGIEKISFPNGSEYFETNDDGNYLIEKSGSKKTLIWTKLSVVPEGVTAIDSGVLKGFENVVIPASVTSIPLDAFDSALQSITVAEGNTTFTDGGNHNMLVNKQSGALIKLTPSAVDGGKIELPETVTSVPANVFSGFGATKIVIPNSVTSIAAQALAGCKGLEKLSLPFPGQNKTSGTFISLFDGSMPTGGENDYFGLDRYALPKTLTEVHVTGSGVALQRFAFKINSNFYSYADTNIETLILPDDISIGGSDAFDTDAKFIKEIDGARYVGSETNSKLILIEGNKIDAMISVSKGTSIIYEYAFEGGALLEVMLPASLTKICDNAFEGCVNLVSVYNLSNLDVKAGATTHGKVALYAASVEHFDSEDEYTGSRVKTEGDWQFVANDVPVLFKYTGSDTEVTFPNKCDGKRYIISHNIFKDNESITSVIIPANSALNVGDSAFENCVNLKSIVMYDLNDSIGVAAFKGCTSLTSITFYNCTLTEISDQAFMNCSAILEIAVPDSVERIGNRAFDGCSSAVAITLGKNVKHLGNLAFARTTNLKSASIPDSVISLDDDGRNDNFNKGGFQFYKSGIESVYIGSGIDTLPRVFDDCTRLAKVTFSKDCKITNLQNGFSNCSALTSFEFPESVNYAMNIFNGCTSLKSLTVSSTLVDLIVVEDVVNLSDVSLDLSKIDAESMQSYALRFFQYVHDNGITVYLPALKGDTPEQKAEFAQKLARYVLYFDAYRLADYYNSYNATQSDIAASTNFGKAMFVLPDKETYDAVHGVFTEDFYNKIGAVNGYDKKLQYIKERKEVKYNFSTYQYEYTALQKPGMESASDFSKHLYYVADVTYELHKQMNDGSTKKVDTQTVQKLAQNEGADIRYALMTDRYGSKYYAIDESFAMPTMIGATNATGDWKVGSASGDAFTLDGAKINGATTLVNVLGADAKLVVNVDEQYTDTYDGEEWTLPASLADKASITSVNGNANGKIINADTYTVVLTAGDDYEFADGQSTATITVVINKADAELVWTYDGKQVLNEDEAFVKTFDGTAIKSKLVISYVDAKGDTQKINLDHLSRTLNGTATMGDAVGAGDWVLYISDLIRDTQYPNYIFAHASQSFRINNVKLTANDVLNGSEIDLTGVATLNSGMLYIYEDNSHNVIPSRTPLTGYTLVEVINVERSIIRYTNHEWTLAASVKSDSADKFAVNNDLTENNTQTAIGRQTTTFVFNAKDNYEFASSINGGVAERGLAFTVSADGKTLTVTKTWYVVQLANELVKATYTGEDEPSDSDLYTVIDWTYGADVSFALPKLWHGSDADNVNHVKFTLKMQGKADDIVSNVARADLLKYLNKYMPAGDYTLTFTVETFDTDDASYPRFTREYDFTVAKASIGIDETKLPKNENTGYASYEWELTANANKELFFKTFADKITATGVLQTVIMEAPTDTFWGTDDGKTYFGNYSVKYNFARMNNERYELATNNYLYEFIAGGSRGTYTVYFQIEMPNHEHLTDIGEEGRYAYFFTVVVFETVDPVDIHLENVTYTGLKNIPTLNETDVYHVEYDENDGYINAGEHALYLVLNDSVHYRWKGVAAGETGLSVKYTIKQALNVFIEAPDIVRWVEGKFDEKENGFIGAAKFGTISYVITDTNDNVIYDLSKNIDKRADMKAGTYILKATVVGNDNYTGLSDAFTIKILEKPGLPWWATLCITLGALLIAALIIFILWKKGVFQILTEKIVVSIRTKASVDATIASVRAAKKMEEGKQSIADAKRRERIEQMRKKAAEQRALPPEERAAQLEERAKADEAKAEKLRARSEAKRQQAAKMRGEKPDAEQPVTEQPTAEAAATETPTEE